MSGKGKVKLSERVNQLPPYIFGRLNALKAARRRSGEDVIDLGMGNPNDPPAREIVDKLCDAVRDRKNHRYSASADGIFNLKKALAEFYRDEWGVELDPASEIVCTIGSKEGLSHLALAITDPGDIILVPTPAFPIHVHGVRLAGGTIAFVPLSTGPEFFENLRKVADEAEKPPKALVHGRHHPDERGIAGQVPRHR